MHVRFFSCFVCSRYWKLERALCQRQAVLREAEIERCARGKSFDYRLMHLAALKLCGGTKVDDNLMVKLNSLVLSWFCFFLFTNQTKQAMLQSFEALIETRDDIMDFEEDEQRNSFNVLLMLGRLHGRGKAREALLTRCAKIEARYKASKRTKVFVCSDLVCSVVFESS
jgi:hypothetical protein